MITYNRSVVFVLSAILSMLLIVGGAYADRIEPGPNIQGKLVAQQPAFRAPTTAVVHPGGEGVYLYFEDIDICVDDDNNTTLLNDQCLQLCFDLPSGWSAYACTSYPHPELSYELIDGVCCPTSNFTYAVIYAPADAQPGVYKVTAEADDNDPTCCGTEGADDPALSFTFTVIVTKGIVVCSPRGTGDRIGGGSGCSSCSGGGSPGVDIDASNGMVAILPESSIEGGSLQMNGDNASLTTCDAKCWEFVPIPQSNDWAGATDPTMHMTLDSIAGTARVYLADGTVYNYVINSSGSEISGVFMPSTVVNSLGQTTSFFYDSETGALTSATMPDGRAFIYEHTGGLFPPTAVVDSEGRRTEISYPSAGSHIEKPTAVKIIDPANTITSSITSYNYYADGKVKSITAPSGLVTLFEYDSSGKLHWMWTINPSEQRTINNETRLGVVYSQTQYAYSDGSVLDYDGTICPMTEIREYAYPETAVVNWDTGGNISSITPASATSSDRIAERYYYPNVAYYKYLKAVKNSLGDGTCTGRVIYDVDVNSVSSNLGKILKVTKTEPDSATTKISEIEYKYYNANTLYNADAATQYNVAIPNSVAYLGPDDAGYSTTAPSVKGNGQPRSETTTVYPSGAKMQSLYRYLISSTGTMTPFATITTTIDDPDNVAGAKGYIKKSVLNGAGQAVEVYEDDGAQPLADQPHSLALTRTYSYYTTSDVSPESPCLGLVKTEEVKNIGANGTSYAQTYTYSYDPGDVDNSPGGIFDHGYTVKATDALGKWKKSHYNGTGQLMWTTDECSRQTDYTYHYLGGVLTTTYPAINGVRSVSQNQYLDCCGKLMSSTDENGNKIWYEYDGFGRTARTWTEDKNGVRANDPLVSYSYNGPFGQADIVTTYSDSTHTRATHYVFDTAGRVVEIDYPAGDSSAGSKFYNEYFHYDDLGRLAAKCKGIVSSGQVQEGTVEAYAYDDSDRTQKVKHDYYGGGTGAWPVASINITSPDAAYAYDNLSGQISTLSEATGDSFYIYNPQGNLVRYQPGFPSGYGQLTYIYNNLGQKTSMTVPLADGANARKITYKYDIGGRQSGMSIDTVADTSSRAHSDTVGDGKTHIVYNENENRVQLTTKAGGVYNFVYDPTASIPSVVYEEGPNYRYVNVREPGGGLLTREKWQNGDRLSAYTYHFDGLGSTLALTDATGAITDRYSYDERGNVSHTALTGSVSDNPYQYVGRYGYYTHYQEPDFKLLQLGVRYYDPQVGRFTQRDPVHLNIGAYIYAKNNTINEKLLDPSGMLPGYGLLDIHQCICNKLSIAMNLHLKSDKLAHCYFACSAQECSPLPGASIVMPLIQDLVEAYLAIQPNGNYDYYDVTANHIGGVCGYIIKERASVPSGQSSRDRNCANFCQATVLPLPNESGPVPGFQKYWRKLGCGMYTNPRGIIAVGIVGTVGGIIGIM